MPSQHPDPSSSPADDPTPTASEQTSPQSAMLHQSAEEEALARALQRSAELRHAHDVVSREALHAHLLSGGTCDTFTDVTEGFISAGAARRLASLYGFHLQSGRRRSMTISQRDQEIIECYVQRHMPMDIIARVFAVQRQRVSQVLDRHGYRSDVPTELNVDAVEEHYRTGKSAGNIAIIMHRSVASVTRYLQSRHESDKNTKEIIRRIHNGESIKEIGTAMRLHVPLIVAFLEKRYAVFWDIGPQRLALLTFALNHGAHLLKKNIPPSMAVILARILLDPAHKESRAWTDEELHLAKPLVLGGIRPGVTVHDGLSRRYMRHLIESYLQRFPEAQLIRDARLSRTKQIASKDLP